MSLDSRMQDALSSPDPFNQLRSLVQRLEAQGHDQPAILNLFEQTRQHLRQAGQDKEEDVVMEVMDCLVGWCSPHMKLEREKQA